MLQQQTNKNIMIFALKQTNKQVKLSEEFRIFFSSVYKKLVHVRRGTNKEEGDSS